MAKDPALGIRLEPEEREALERAADADERALSAMARKILVEWLRTNDWLPERRLVARETHADGEREKKGRQKPRSA